MRYSIENDTLRLTVDTHGAEAVSVIHKPTGAELLWSGDPSVWGRHAPILFPYTGKLTGGKMIAKGVEYAGGQHGFARDVEHAMTRHTADTLEFELHANPETLPLRLCAALHFCAGRRDHPPHPNCGEPRGGAAALWHRLSPRLCAAL